MKIAFIAITFLCISFILLSYLSYAQPAVGERQRAQEIWERMVEAKGGRTRLDAVRTFIVSSSSSSAYRSKSYPIRVESVYVLPDRFWSWQDMRPNVWGLSMMMYDWRLQKEYTVYSEGPSFAGLRDMTSNMPNTRLAGLASDLLETGFNQPIPKSVAASELNGRHVLLLSVELNGSVLQYFVDDKTYLPIMYIGLDKGGHEGVRIRFDDYADFDGIKMAKRVTFENPDSTTVYVNTYQFNVDVDDRIFTKPPSFNAGPEAWKK